MSDAKEFSNSTLTLFVQSSSWVDVVPMQAASIHFIY